MISMMAATMGVLLLSGTVLWRAYSGIVWCVQQQRLQEARWSRVACVVRWAQEVEQVHGGRLRAALPVKVDIPVPLDAQVWWHEGVFGKVLCQVVLDDEVLWRGLS